jgi:hypothetical protein
MFINYEIKLEKAISDNMEVKEFIKKHHYLPSFPRGCNKIYCLYISGKLCGVAAIGIPVSRFAAYKYDITLELRRFVLIPDMPKNTASWFIGKIMKTLRGKGYKGIISYADPTHGHVGTIYKASNFKYLGVQKYKTPYYLVNDIKVYGRNIHCTKTSKYNNIVLPKVKWEEPKYIFRLGL